MKKLIAIGDIHGRNDWSNIIAQNIDADKFIFVGDYFDTHENISPEQQIQNFNVLMQIKYNAPDRIIFLIGNHDFHYLSYAKEHYSGFQLRYANEIGALLQHEVEKNNLQMCFEQNGFLFTHAGVSRTWCKLNRINTENIEYSINATFRYAPQTFKFSPGFKNNPYGDEVGQSPIWIRPGSLRKDWVDSYIQVVGHTVQEKIDVNCQVVFIDTLGTSKEYLEVEIFDNGTAMARVKKI